MTITQEKTDALQAQIKIALKKEDIEVKVKAGLKKLGKVIQLKGFRTGQVPPAMVKKMYGSQVMSDELNELLQNEVMKYVETEKLDILGYPIPVSNDLSTVDVNNISDTEFTFEIGYAPEVDMKYIDGSPVFTKYKIVVEEKLVDEEVERARKRFATYAYPEDVAENDILTFTIEELNEAGELKEGGVSTVSSIMADLLKDEPKAKVLTMKKQDSAIFNPFELMERDREGIAKNILNMPDTANLDSLSPQFRFTLNNITRSVPAEMNEEFFAKAFGQNGPRSEEEMRANIRKDLEHYFDGQTDSYLVNDMYKGIMANMEFPLPDTFLKRWIKLNNEKEMSAEDVERDYPKFQKQMRWDLITRKLIRENGFEATEEEIRGRVRANLIQQLYGYGMTNMGDEWLEQFVQKQLEDKKVISQTTDQILDEKVMSHLKSKVQLQEKEVDMATFQGMVSAANGE